MSFLLEAQNTWENFAKYKINDYAKLRNFKNLLLNKSLKFSISLLSKYV